MNAIRTIPSAPMKCPTCSGPAPIPRKGLAFSASNALTAPYSSSSKNESSASAKGCCSISFFIASMSLLLIFGLNSSFACSSASCTSFSFFLSLVSRMFGRSRGVASSSATSKPIAASAEKSKFRCAAMISAFTASAGPPSIFFSFVEPPDAEGAVGSGIGVFLLRLFFFLPPAASRDTTTSTDEIAPLFKVRPGKTNARDSPQRESNHRVKMFRCIIMIVQVTGAISPEHLVDRLSDLSTICESIERGTR
mmetsp:Transcript_46432/g.140606  ORF Transcript_46432/g.140606 Transcript_46432/m.140606 type:complete len:251 (+) Transcript_46432:1771-2523(+)